MSNPGRSVVRAGEGVRDDLGSLVNRYLVEADEVAVIEHTLAPRALAAPMHTHHHEDEQSFVISGRIGAQIGEEIIEAGPGDFVLKPRGLPHTFWNASDDEARVLEVISPGRFAHYFHELAQLLVPEPDFPAIAVLAEKYRLSLDMDSIGPLLERHGLKL